MSVKFFRVIILLTLIYTVIVPTFAQSAPAANNDYYVMPANTASLVNAPGVLANDVSPANGQLELSVMHDPEHGTVAHSPNGGFVYTPDSGYVGTDIFRYQMRDQASGGTAEARVAIIVGINKPFAPQANHDEVTTSFNTPIAEFSVLKNDIDPNNNALTVALLAPPSSGTATLTADGKLNYTPNTSFVGNDILRYQVTDATGLTDVADVFIGVNQPARFSLHTVGTIPRNPIESDAAPVTLGTRFRSSEDGVINGIRFYKGTTLSGLYEFQLWDQDGRLVRSERRQIGSQTGWIQFWFFDTPNRIKRNAVYTVAYFNPNGRYAVDEFAFPPEGIDRGPLHFLGSNEGGNGVYAYSGMPGIFPRNVYNNTDYYIDVQFEKSFAPVAQNDTYTFRKNSFEASPFQGVLSNDTDPRFVGLNAELVTGTTNGTLTLEANGQFKYTPNQNFVGTDTFTYRVRNQLNLLSDVATVTIYVIEPFRGGVFFNDLNPIPLPVPTNPVVNDSQAVTVGMRFTTNVPGSVRGVRFYKGTTQSGLYTLKIWDDQGRELWSRSNNFGSLTGWMQIYTESVVPIEPGRVYTVGYHTPIGLYAGDNNFFANGGVVNGPLRALGGSEEANGVFAYGATPQFPTQTYQATNYYVDVYFQTIQ